MRADRLISLVMLLQSRGRMTAVDLADELEVSVRTVYRDLTALSASGVPVFAESGPGGGIGLVEEYRTSLTGLTPTETRALFTLGVPAPIRQLGLGREFRQALLKLSAALPDSRRQDEAQSRQRILLDSSGWFQGEQALPALAVIQQALFSDHCLQLRVHRKFFDIEFDMVVQPLGLVAKANLWHLVYAKEANLHVMPVEEILQAELLDEIFERPAEFDLQAFWERWCREYEANPPFIARVRVSQAILPSLWHTLEPRGRRALTLDGSPDAEGWVTLELQFESLINARTVLLGLGRAVEVLEPEALRKGLIDLAEQITDFYRQKGGDKISTIKK